MSNLKHFINIVLCRGKKSADWNSQDLKHNPKRSITNFIFITLFWGHDGSMGGRVIVRAFSFFTAGTELKTKKINAGS